MKMDDFDKIELKKWCVEQAVKYLESDIHDNDDKLMNIIGTLYKWVSEK